MTPVILPQAMASVVSPPGPFDLLRGVLVALPGSLGSLPVTFERPLALLAIPALVPVLWFLIVRRSGPSETGRRPRLYLFGSRLLVVGLLATAAAGPYTVAVRETPGEPSVAVLVDESASTGVAPEVADRLERSIEAAGVPATTTTVASGDASPLGDAVVANLRPGGSVVLVSDGRVTEGRSLESAAEIARGINATISAVPLRPRETERYVSFHGPGTTSVGVENVFLARVGGANLDGRESRVTVSADGQQIAEGTVQGEGSIEVIHRFNRTGTHRLVARVEGGDRYATNDAFYRTVRVVEQPRLLYVSRGAYPLLGYLDGLYNVTAAESVPSDLSSYYAVVVQDLAADDLGDVEALQQFVIDGNGLVVVGGTHAYERGDYANSTFASMLPVSMEPPGSRRANVVLAIDISQSTAGGIRIQKALALDALDQMGDENAVGVVAFNNQVYRIADLTTLGGAREEIADKIRRLESGGGTHIAAGLQGAGRMLDGQRGTIVLISDGISPGDRTAEVASRLGENGIRIISIGVGDRIDTDLLVRAATLSGGTYLRADETNRLRILFGDDERRFQGGGLTVVNRNHFITAGVTTTASLPEGHLVSVKDGSDFLVASGSGAPAITSWRYGLGRVVSITVYASDGGLGPLLAQPDSLLVSKSVNWVIGDPERKEEGVVEISDARVGEPVAVVYRGAERPDAPGLSLQRSGEGIYRATVVPDRTGFHPVLDTEYAANYPVEYGGFGPVPALDTAVAITDGRSFEPEQGAEIAAFARRRAQGLREVRTEWRWALLVAALVAYLLEIGVRRLGTYRGRGTIP